MRLDGSGGGLGQAGRVLEFVDERLEQENDQQMSEDVRSGGPFVRSRRSLQANQALQSLEAEFDAPTQAIERENIIGGKLIRGQ